VLKIDVLRAASESEAQAEGSCGICTVKFELGPVYAQMSIGTGPFDLCERCLRALCDGARSESLAMA
jgi:hypothetical protein